MITTHKINIGREPFRNLGGIETANRSHTGKRTRFRAKFPTPIFFKILHARSFRWESGLARSGAERFLPPLPLGGCCPDEPPYSCLLRQPQPPAHGNASRNGAKCRQEIRNATNKTGPDGVGLFLCVIPVWFIPVRRVPVSPWRFVSNCKPFPLSRWCTFGTSGTPPPVAFQTLPVNVSCRGVCSFVGSVLFR